MSKQIVFIYALHKKLENPFNLIILGPSEKLLLHLLKYNAGNWKGLTFYLSKELHSKYYKELSNSNVIVIEINSNINGNCMIDDKNNKNMDHKLSEINMNNLTENDEKNILEENKIINHKGKKFEEKEDRDKYVDKFLNTDFSNTKKYWEN